MDKKISLVVLAAGMGSRFGGGIKQLEPIGPNGELIIDYSIHDAVEAGFNSIVFIIRKAIYDDFNEVIGTRMSRELGKLGVEWKCVFQEREDLPGGFTCPAERTKPWGTGQAVLACREVLDGPYAVINADDYYGKEAFRKAFKFLSSHSDAKEYGVVCYTLGNTLSENGTVTRGVCRVENGIIKSVKETHGIVKGNGCAVGEYGDMPLDIPVSMNFWMFPAQFTEVLKNEFPVFLGRMRDPLKDEFLLPVTVDRLLREGRCTVVAEYSSEKWFGITYKEDKAAVSDAFDRLYKEGIYKNELFGDLTGRE